MRYYIADTHFGHEALNHMMDRRGFKNAEEMDEYMIRRWNEKVRKNDEVVILGDFSWGNGESTQKILERLNGKLYLIVGNHDHFLKDRKFDPGRFCWIKEYAEMHDNKRKVILSHYPIACYNGQYRRNGQGEPRTFMLHGHIHNTQDQVYLDAYQDFLRKQQHESIAGTLEDVPSQIINCFCMFSDYQPMSLDEWIEIDRKRKSER